MTAPAAERRPAGLPLDDTDAPALDVVIPVHNEEVDLAGSVARVHAHLARLPIARSECPDSSGATRGSRAFRSVDRATSR